VASGAITTTIAILLMLVLDTKSPGPAARGFWESLASAQGLAGDRPIAGPVAIPEPKLLTHGR